MKRSGLKRKPPNPDSPSGRAYRKVLGPKKRKPLRRNTKLRKRSRSSYRTLITKADRALQDYHRAVYAGQPCESCGEPFHIMHHVYEKSRSAGLRFDPLNLVRLCHGCHYRHHRVGDPDVLATIIKARGIDWWDKLQAQFKATKGQDLKRDYLEAQLLRWTLKDQKPPEQPGA